MNNPETTKNNAALLPKARYKLDFFAEVKFIAVGAAPALLASSIWPDDSGARSVTEFEIKKRLWEAVRAGNIEARNPITEISITPPADGMTWGYDCVHESARNALLLSVPEFVKFAEALDIDVSIQPAVKNTRAASNAKGKTPDDFTRALNELLEEINTRTKKNGGSLDIKEMPGTKEDLRAIACKFDSALDVAPRTFDDYVAGKCKFKRGRPADGATNPYAKLFPEYG